MTLNFSNEPLTANFKRGEFTFSEMATRKEINNSPSLVHWANLKALAETCLEPARDVMGPIHITSGYRCHSLNTVIGGAASSQHMLGEAADIMPTTKTLAVLFVWLYKNSPFDQLIWEFGQWVHISHKLEDPQRGEALLAYKKNGRSVYAPLDPEQLSSL